MRVSLLYFNAKISFLEEIHLNKREHDSVENLYVLSWFHLIMKVNYNH